MSNKSMAEIIPLVYQASTQPEIWAEIAEKMSKAFGDAAIAITGEPVTPGEDALMASSRFDSGLHAIHDEKYDEPEQNPGMCALSRAMIGNPISLAAIFDQCDYERDPAARAILHPEKIDKGSMVQFERSGKAYGFLTVFRRTNQSELEDADGRKLSELSWHIAKSRQLHRLLAARSKLHENLQLTVQLSSAKISGLLVLNGTGDVVEADENALAILHTKEGLALNGGRLCCIGGRKGKGSDGLDEFLSEAPAPSRPFILWARDGTLISLERLPKPDGLVSGGYGACHLIVITRIRPDQRPDFDAFAAAYQLTPAESRVIIALADVPTAARAAEKLSISRDTIKTHLARIYDKTGVESLPQLLMLLGRFA